MMTLGIKFRPNKPASLHLNGKVERSQKTDKAEFYATVDIDSDENYRKVVDTVNAHYMAILTDLLNSASPLTEELDSTSR